MEIVIDELGYIRGGLCDKEHHRRIARENGAWWLWRLLKKHGYVAKDNRVLKQCEWDFRWIGKRVSSGDMELGALRFREYHNEKARLAAGILAEGSRPYPKDIKLLINRLSGYVTLPPQAPLGLLLGSKLGPQSDDIFKKRRKRGDFDQEENSPGI